MLHDVLEDYPVNYSDIKKLFGPRITKAVTLLTKIKDDKKRQYKQYFDALKEDPIGSVIKAMDRIHNQSTMTSAFSNEKKSEYLKETDDWIIPMLLAAKENFPQQNEIYDKALRVLNWQKRNTTKQISNESIKKILKIVENLNSKQRNFILENLRRK